MGIDMNILNDLLGAQIKNTDCTCFACMVTPELAEKLLKLNISNNRSIRQTHVTELAHEIKAGKFPLSPNPISINTDGKLVDGQHRLKAIIEADTPAPLYVMVGVRLDAVIDRSLIRSLHDSLYMRGLIPSDMAKKDVIGVVNRYLNIDLSAQNKKIPDSIKADFLNEHGYEAINAVRISRMHAHNGIGGKAAVQAAILGALINGVPEKMLDSFVMVLNTGYYDNEGQTAAILLCNSILKDMYGNLSGKKSDLLCATTEMCIQDFTKGTPRKQMYRTLRHVYINGKEETWPKAG